MKVIIPFFFSLLIPVLIIAQLNPTPVAIPLTDGNELAGDLYLPNDTDQFPTILIQTPYNKNFYQLTGLPLGIGFDIAPSDYAILIVDWRCFFESSSACTLNFNRGEDGYDVVEWVAEQSWSDGKVGTWGPSALGNIQFETARNQPPHLVCAVPVVPSPQFHYYQYFPGGAIRTEYMQLVGTYFGFLDIVASNPYHNLIWTIAENNSMYPEEIEIPMMLIGGWFDHNTNDNVLLFDTLRNASSPSVRDEHRLLMGPWTHGSEGLEQQGALSFPEAAFWSDSLALAFFDSHLMEEANDWENSPSVQFFQMGENDWRSSDTWPPVNTFEEVLYLHDDQFIRYNPPTYDSDFLSYEYDPEDPSPTIGGRTLALNLDQGPYDQNPEVESRSDNLIFSTGLLLEALPVQGKIKVKLFVSSDRIDTDLVLRLTDVYPDGRSMLIGESVLRMHYRNGNTVADTAYMQPGEVYEVELAFDHLAHTFDLNHQLRLIISSSNYPRYNRNMNTGGPMYPNGNIDTLVNPIVATNSIFTGQTYPSVIVLPLAGGTVGTMEVSQTVMDLIIAPNPNRGEVFIRGVEAWKAIEVINMQGQVIFQDRSGGFGDYILNTTGWNQGVYMVKVGQHNLEIRTGRIVVVR